MVSVGSYRDQENGDFWGLIVWCNQSGETLKTIKIDLGGDEELIDVWLDQEKDCYVAGDGSSLVRAGLRPAKLIRARAFQAPYFIIAKFDSLGERKWAIVDSPYCWNRDRG